MTDVRLIGGPLHGIPRSVLHDALKRSAPEEFCHRGNADALWHHYARTLTGSDEYVYCGTCDSLAAHGTTYRSAYERRPEPARREPALPVFYGHPYTRW